MKKKYIITETYVHLKDMSGETLVIGVSEVLDEAKNILDTLRITKIKLGYDKANFEMFDCGWYFKHIAGFIKAEIHFI